MPYHTIHQRRYYYEKEGAGPPLLLMGGYTSDISLWTPVRARLASKFQLLMIDNYGIGRTGSGSATLSLEQMAQDSLLLAQEVGFAMPHVVGHSMGGAMAQILAWRYPEQINKVVFAQTFTKISPAPAIMMQTIVKLFEEGVSARRRAEVSMPWIFSDNFLTNPKRIETFLSSFEKTAHPQTLEGLKHQLTALLQFDSSSWYHLITKPALVLAGKEDRLCLLKEVELLAAQIPGAFLHIFDNVGHVAPAEDPEEFCRVIAHYLL